jgi:TPR repeat protein
MRDVRSTLLLLLSLSACAAAPPQASTASASRASVAEPSRARAAPPASAPAGDERATACEGGDAGACVLLGLSLLPRDEDRYDGAPALARFEQGCRLGHKLGCEWAGVFHHTGLGGVPIDMALAEERYQRACPLGSALSCRWAASFAKSRGQLEVALDFWERGCSLGDSLSCDNLQAR